MATISVIQPRQEVSWGQNLVSLLPLWLVTLAVSGEGFPAGYKPSILVAEIAFGAAILAGVVLALKRWLPLLLLLYSFLPLSLLPVFDEISTEYKTPFLLMCALIASVWAILYLRARSPWRVLILVAGAAVTYALANYAMFNYWDWVAALNYGQCFPGQAACPPLPDRAWWQVFLGIG